MNQRILVTGGTGLLGSYFLRWFRKKGYSDITGTFQNPNAVFPSDLKEVVQWKRLRLPDVPDAYDAVANKDWVIHNAGLVSYFKEDRYKLLAVNQQGTEHIVNACLEHGVKHLIYIGSIAALGKESNNVTVNETSPWVENEYTTSYALSKYLGELEAWRGAAEGLNVSVILPSVILGTGDWHRSSLQIIDRVANKIPMYPGGQTGYVDVRDIVQFAGMLLEKSIAGDRWILSAENIPYREIYQRIAKELGTGRQFMQAPQWLAKTVLLLSNLTTGRWSMPEIAGQVYRTTHYDNSKSRGVNGFDYRLIDDTLREVVSVYKEGKEGKVLEF